MTRKYKFAIGAVLLVGAIGYLMFAGVQQSSLYYVTMEEFASRQASLVNQGVRVAGRVSAGSVQKQTSEKGTSLKFSIGDFVASGLSDGTALLPVEYTGVVPDMFAEGRDVIVEGTYANGVLRAQTVMTSCPSKYEPAVAEAEARAGKASAN